MKAHLWRVDGERLDINIRSTGERTSFIHFFFVLLYILVSFNYYHIRPFVFDIYGIILTPRCLMCVGFIGNG